MTTLRFASFFATVAMAVAQSPLSLPFNSNSGLGVNSAIFFDLAASVPITLTELNVNSNSPIGTAGQVEVYVTPVTYVGSQQVPANWTLAASGFVQSAGLDQPSRVCLGGGVQLPTGSYGLYVRHVGIALRYTTTTGTHVASTAELTFSGGQSAASSVPFGSAPINNRRFNGNIAYVLGIVAPVGCASFKTGGTGCYLRTDSYYEDFTGFGSASRPFDLAGSPGMEQVIRSTQGGCNATITPLVASAWYTPQGAPLLNNNAIPGVMGDDNMSIGLTLPFPFTFNCCQTTVMQVHACVNGFIHLGPTTATTGDFTPTVAEMLSGAPRMFPCWGDWQANINTSSPTGVYYDVDMMNQAVYVTWLNVADRRGQVPAANLTTLNFQCKISANGDYEYRYRNFLPAAAGVGAVIVGFSKGNLGVSGAVGSLDPGIHDISVRTLLTDCDKGPLKIDTSLPPYLGSTWSIDTKNVDPILPIAFTVISLNGVIPSGLHLDFIGAPGCYLYLPSFDVSVTLPVAGGMASLLLPIPNNPALAGVTISAQSMCFTLLNPLNLLTSNALEGTLGQ